MLPRHFAAWARRLSHAGVAVVIVAVTVVLVVQSTAGVGAVTSSVVRLMAGPIRVPPQNCPVDSNAAPHRRALVLFDNQGAYAAYATQMADLAANFVSHFALPVLQPVTLYHRGEMTQYAAVVYVGTTFGEPLPAGFLSDMRAATRPVLWLGENVSDLTSRAFARAHGWRVGADRQGDYTSVVYRHVRLEDNSNDLTGIDILNPAKAAVLATATTAGGRSTPWAVRSGDLTYVAEVPLDDGNGSGVDRSFAVADMMEAIFGPAQPRHRMLVRLEDVGPSSDPVQLRQIADLLSTDHIPFSIALYPVYVGPVTQHPRVRYSLNDRPQVVDAIKYMLAKGGTLILHGYTHQLGGQAQPQRRPRRRGLRVPARPLQRPARRRLRRRARQVIPRPGPGTVSAWHSRRSARPDCRGLSSGSSRSTGPPQPNTASRRPSSWPGPIAVSYAQGWPGHVKLQTLTEQSAAISRPGCLRGPGASRDPRVYRPPGSAGIRARLQSASYWPLPLPRRPWSATTSPASTTTRSSAPGRCGNSSTASGRRATEFASACAVLRG